jgi:hypothetical protein
MCVHAAARRQAPAGAPGNEVAAAAAAAGKSCSDLRRRDLGERVLDIAADSSGIVDLDIVEVLRKDHWVVDMAVAMRLAAACILAAMDRPVRAVFFGYRLFLQ